MRELRDSNYSGVRVGRVSLDKKAYTVMEVTEGKEESFCKL